MYKIYLIIVFYFITRVSFSQNLFVADTFTNTINLDLSQNLYLKSVPADLINGYLNGEWNAYYPKREMNQCLIDDFLQRFNLFQLLVNNNSNSCFENYFNNDYYQDVIKQFSRKLRFKEVVYFDQQHSIVKREVLWVQVYFSREEYDGWKHYDGPIFWLLEINKSNKTVMVSNKNRSSNSWTLTKEFSTPKFIVNENKQKEDKKKLNKILQTEEN